LKEALVRYFLTKFKYLLFGKSTHLYFILFDNAQLLYALLFWVKTDATLSTDLRMERAVVRL
jgi:hypothetical protein